MATATVRSRFTGVDFYGLDSLLAEEERAVRDTIRAWVDEHLMPIIGECYVEGRFPRELIPGMAELGILGASLPEEYGCAGLNNVAYGLIMQELERGDSGIRSFASVQGGLVMYPIFAFGSEEQKRHWLPRLAGGQEIGCFGLTEPDFGSNPAGMITTARESRGRVGAERDQDVDHQRLPGHGGDHLGQDRRRSRTRSRSAASSCRPARRATQPRIRRASCPSARRTRARSICEDVRLPKDAVLPRSGGIKSPLMCLTQARYGIAWGAVGAAMACYDEAVSYAKSRIMFGKPIGQTQIQQVRLADMLTEITKAQLLVLQLGRLKDAGTMTPEQVSLAKRNNVSMACDCAREARRLLGANGILAEYHSMRHLANLESVYTYEGTHDMHSLILGQAITGLSAFV